MCIRMAIFVISHLESARVSPALLHSKYCFRLLLIDTILNWKHVPRWHPPQCPFLSIYFPLCSQDQGGMVRDLCSSKNYILNSVYVCLLQKQLIQTGEIFLASWNISFFRWMLSPPYIYHTNDFFFRNLNSSENHLGLLPSGLKLALHLSAAIRSRMEQYIVHPITDLGNVRFQREYRVKKEPQAPCCVFQHRGVPQHHWEVHSGSWTPFLDRTRGTPFFEQFNFRW